MLYCIYSLTKGDKTMITKSTLVEITSQLTAGLTNIETSLDDLSMNMVQKDDMGNTVVDNLFEIQYQLKRIADALEKK
jgi:hypothetical protein